VWASSRSADPLHLDMGMEDGEKRERRRGTDEGDESGEGGAACVLVKLPFDLEMGQPRQQGAGLGPLISALSLCSTPVSEIIAVELKLLS
jgi:hypothetical protein